MLCETAYILLEIVSVLSLKYCSILIFQRFSSVISLSFTCFNFEILGNAQFFIETLHIAYIHDSFLS